MTPWLDDGDVRLYHGDCLEVLRRLPDRSVHMCATSPPFYGLRDYGTGSWEGGDPDCDHSAAKIKGRADYGFGDKSQVQTSNTAAGYSAYKRACPCGARRVDRQIGLEETPDQWVDRLVAVFREVRRVLRDDGTLWVEIGDSYGANQGSGFNSVAFRGEGHVNRKRLGQETPIAHPYKQKDLLGQPWLLAFALRADGWYLRSEIIWARPNPMPESVTDRPTKSHSTVFLLSKRPRYFYDADAIRELSVSREENLRKIELGARGNGANKDRGDGGHGNFAAPESGANARSVWQIPTEPTPFAHFATWPQALVRRMVLAGTSERGCCPECGAPWVRDVERERTYESNAGKAATRSGSVTLGDSGHPRSDVATGATHDLRLGPTTTTRTLGWSPSCAHNLEPVPCTVLDPFAGSATTMLVARNHGRHSVGIELNENYLHIAAKRLHQLSLLTGNQA